LGKRLPDAIITHRGNKDGLRVVQSHDPALANVVLEDNGPKVCMTYLYTGSCKFGDSCRHPHVTTDAAGLLIRSPSAALSTTATA
jgi:hypothetical protein